VSSPTLPTHHDEYEALAVAWAVNALEPADQAVFEAHRDGCERCARAVYAALEVAAELAYGVPDAAPPARLRHRVLAGTLPPRPSSQSAARVGRADAAAARSTAGGHADRSGRRAEAGRGPEGSGPGRVARAIRRPRRLVYALVAAVLAVGSAVTAWEVMREAPVTDRIAALSAGSGTIATVVAHQDRADVVTDMLPPNTGRGTAYYVWGVPAEDGGTPQVVGTFEVTTTGLHSYPLRLTRSLDGYPVLAISEERAGSTPSAPTSVLGKGALGS
jgi:anti-sigma-K factor RskA